MLCCPWSSSRLKAPHLHAGLRDRVALARRRGGFTLIELCIVLLVIAIVAALVAPNLAMFSKSRQTDNAAMQILDYARYARTQSICEGRTYRVNFDSSARTYWVTVDQGGGTFAAVPGARGQQTQLPAGVQMEVQVTAQPNMLFNKTALEQSNELATPTNPQLIDNTQLGTAGQVMIPQRTDGGTYIEFQSTGRADPATITLTDSLRRKIQILNSTPSEPFHIPAGGST